LQRAEENAQESETRSEAAAAKAQKALMSLAEKEEEKKTIQSELDDLLMVFSDLEAKATKYKEKLKALGETISDDEEEDDDLDDDVD
jgi:intracellular protein transport protein USO1